MKRKRTLKNNRIQKKNSRKIISPWWFENQEQKLQRLLVLNNKATDLEKERNE